MALRAGYYGLKRRIRDKLLKLSDAIPEGIGPDNPIASKSDVLTAVDLLDDTVGWLGGNECPKFTNQSRMNADFTVDADGIITPSGTATQQTQGENQFTLKAGTYRLSGAPAGSSSGSYDIYIQNITAGGEVIARDYDGSSLQQFTLSVDSVIRVNLRVPQGALDTSKKFKPMILTLVQYALNPSYRPYHESVAEILTPKLLPNNADLNNYLSIGDYICDANINTYTNIPAEVNNTLFKLRITPFNVTASRSVQIILVNKAIPEVYIRTNFAGTWQSWYKFTGTEVTPPTTQITAQETETKKATKKSTAKAD